MQVEASSHHKLSERFEAAFNQIHEFLKRKVNIFNDKFQALLNEGAKRHEMINTYKEDLTKYAKLRNVLVHEKVDVGYYIAEPNPQIVARIEKIAAIFNQPNYALSIATKRVISFDTEDSILLVVQGIKEHAYAQYPVYQNNEFIGLLTNAHIVHWFAEHIHNSILDLREVQVKDIIKNVSEHPVQFVPKTINIFEVEEIFENAHKSNKNIEAIIITENGNRKESPLGLITAWDLIEIDYTAD